MKVSEILASILGLLLSIATYWGSLYFPKFQVSLAGPEFFPRVLAVFLGLLSLLLLFQSLREKKSSIREDQEKSQALRWSIFYKVILGMLACALYFLAMKTFGFVISTIAYFSFLMFLMQTKKKILKTIIWSVTTTIVTYAIFAMGLKATLPSGLIFR